MNLRALYCDPAPSVAEALRANVGGHGLVFTDLRMLHEHLLAAVQDDTVVLGPGVPDDEAFAVAEFLRIQRPALTVVLVRKEGSGPLTQRAMRAGIFELVTDLSGSDLRDAVVRSVGIAMARRRHGPPTPPPVPPPEAPEPARGQVVTVFSAKGGCGKTTLATNLATALAERGRRQVCLVDLDLTFGDVAIAMQLFPAHTIADAVPMSGSLDAGAVQALLTSHSAGLSALVAPTDPSLAESIPAPLIARLLDILRDEFDYIVIDTPPTFDDQVLAALDVSDLIALIVTPDVPALKNLKITIETLLELRYPHDRFRLLLNRADAKVGITHAEVEGTADLRLSAQIPSSRDVPAAINRGVPIVQDDPRHPVSQAIRLFAEREVAAAGRPEGGSRTEYRHGRLGRLRRRRNA